MNVLIPVGHFAAGTVIQPGKHKRTGSYQNASGADQ